MNVACTLFPSSPRSRAVWSTLALMVTLSAPGESAAGDGDASAADMYDDDDEDKALKLKVEGHLGLFLVKPPRRHASEVVELRRGRATIRYWYSLGPDADRVACDGLRWMVFGRDQWGGGAPGVFDDTEITEINLHFVHVPKPRPGKKSRARDFHKFVEMRLSTRKMEDLEVDEAMQAVESGEGCGRFMKRHFDRYRFNSRYYKRELARHSRR